MRLRSFLALLGPFWAVLSGFIRPAHADDWPTYRHDIRRSGVTAERLAPEKLREAWVYRSPVPPRTAWGSPARWDAYANIRGLRAMRTYDRAFHVAVVGEALYFGSSVDDAVHCLEASTGKERWAFFTDAPVRIAPTVADGRVFFGSDDGRAYCIRAADGKKIWVSELPEEAPLILHNGRFITLWPCRSGVLIDGGTAYFGLSMLPWKPSYLAAVDADTGKTEGPGRYLRKLSRATIEGALVASRDRIIAPQGRIAPLLLNRIDGQPKGSPKEGGGGSFVSLSADGRLVHGPGNKTGWVTATDLETLKPVGKYPGKIARVTAGPRAFLLADTEVTAMDSDGKKVIWKASCPLAFDLIVAGDAVYVGGLDRVLALSAENGRLLWEAPVLGRAYGLAVSGGALFVSTDEGTIHCFRPTGQGTNATRRSPSRSDSRRTAPPARPSRRIAARIEPGLTDRWVFHGGMAAKAKRRGVRDAERHVDNLAGKSAGRIRGGVEIREAGGLEALWFDGKSNSVMIAEDHREAKLPVRAITAEAWVRVDQPLKWGGIIGCIQDNGDDEKGWLLGYTDSTFSFALAGKDANGRLTYLSAKTPFKKGVWYHVMGTYDGTTQKIYVNGKLENTATGQKGDIRYPPRAFYEIGAYHDRDEYYRMTGLLHEVRVYRRALGARDAAAHHAALERDLPRSIDLALGPIARFTGRTTAQVHWRTRTPSPSLLEIDTGDGFRRISEAARKLSHTLTVTGLKAGRIASYRIATIVGGKPAVTPTFELDSHFNYSIPAFPDRPAPFPRDPSGELAVRAAGTILEETGVRQGVCLVLGCRDGRLAYELARSSDLRVIGVDTDPKRIDAARRMLLEAGVYGSRIALRTVPSLSNLPFTSRFANLIVSDSLLEENVVPSDAGEVTRVLRPGGGVAYLGRPAGAPTRLPGELLKRWGAASDVRVELSAGKKGVWARVVRSRLQGAGDWSHQYGLADNSAFGGETLDGARTSGDLRVQWIGRPGPRAQPDRNGRKPSPLSTNGRLFVQGLHRLIGLDAYNGTILWALEIPPLERFNVPRDSGNWCADENYVYAAVKDRCWQIDAGTGALARVHEPVPVPGREAVDWSYLARVGSRLLGSSVPKGTAFTSFWGGAGEGWYDARSGPATFKVCSENLFGIDAGSGRRVWTYRSGVIINSTLTATENKAFFVECRNEKVVASVSRRVGMPELWKDRFLVALDVESGRKLWEKPLDTKDGTVVFYMATGKGKLVIVASSDKEYEVTTFDARDGKPGWSRSIPWPGGKGDHGKAMSRPAIVDYRVYVRPQAFDLTTGKPLKHGVPGGGCGTYAATTNTLIFRSSDITIWDTVSGRKSGWTRLRPGCWLSTIPAGGMLLSPEAGGGCSCGSWMEASMGFTPDR